jgi:hypothetical protein
MTTVDDRKPKSRMPPKSPVNVAVPGGRANRAERIAHKYATAVSLDLPDELPFEDWRDMGAAFGRASTTLQWLIGDWWHYGCHRYGDRIQAVESWVGLSFQACEDCAWVCGKFEASRRREVLSFTHHREVAGLDPTEADRLLDWSMLDEKNFRSTRELREEVQRLRSEDVQQRVAKRLEDARIMYGDASPRPRVPSASRQLQRILFPTRGRTQQQNHRLSSSTLLVETVRSRLNLPS